MADLRWNPVSVNFNDASALMRNAGDSISKAGTVFGELRKSILDEEQRAIENAYKEKAFAEGIRQFNERLGFDKSKWGDEKLLKEAEQKETHRHNEASERNQAESNAIHRLSVNNAQNQWKADYALRVAPIRAWQEQQKARSEDIANMSVFGEKKQAYMGPELTEKQKLQNDAAALENALENDPTLTPEQFDANALRYRDIVNRVAEINSKEAEFDKAYKPKLNITDDSSLGLYMDLNNRIVANGGLPMGLKDSPLGELYLQGVSAKSAAEQQAFELKKTKIAAEVKEREGRWKDANKPLHEYYKADDLNTNWYGHADEEIAKIREAAESMGYKLSNRDLYAIYRQTYDIRGDLIGSQKSPEGMILNRWSGRREITPENIRKPLTNQYAKRAHDAILLYGRSR